jgi:phage-related protein
MEGTRTIQVYKRYFIDFMESLTKQQRRKVDYSIDMLKTQDRVASKFMKHIRNGLYELRSEYEGDIFRVFFIFDDGNIVILFNGFQKKTQKTPEREIKKALTIMNDYYAAKGKI